ncbi:hypothetical protein [Georgenia wangjunii]|uniref:hypothetical protein n=1 Tax=Georgenia wangjunii TaxID=3117730 RepID=UPI002F2619BA
MSTPWPPPGHAFVYQVREDLEGRRGAEYELSLPSSVKELSLSTMQIEGRIGGDTPADLMFREELFRWVGSVTVAGGHIEAAMKRLLLILTGIGSRFRLVDYQWAELEKRLRKECDGSDERRRRLEEVLDWAERRNLRENRHTVVHGSWWLYAGVDLRVDRWPRKDEDRTILTDWKWIKTLSADCWSFADKIEKLVGDDWSRAMIAAESPPPTFGGTPSS